ncbi:MAG: hypothetical protein R3E66_16830 [bacterium]
MRILLAIMLWALPCSALADAPTWYGDDIQDALPAIAADATQSASAGPPSDDVFEEYQPDDETDEDGFDGDPAYGDSVAPLEDGNQGELTDDEGDWTEDGAPTGRRGIEGPRPPEIPDPDPPGWLEDFLDWLKSFDGPDVDVTALLQWAKYIGIGLLGLVLVAYIIRLIRRNDVLPLTEDEGGSALDALRELTGAQHHSTLADVQQWDIAIHALLLDVFERLQPSHEFVGAPAVTCREIASRIEPLGGPLTQLVAISESSVFAMIPASEEDYLRALSLHSTLVGGR